jgi:hypothetical protein
MAEFLELQYRMGKISEEEFLLLMASLQSLDK